MNSGILFCHMKKPILPCATTWREVAGIMLSEISHAEKDKCQLISLTWGLPEIRKGVIEQDSSTRSEPKNGLTVTKGNGTEEDGLGGRGERENGAVRVAHRLRPGGVLR